MNLFVFYIGGMTANSNIEVHDVRFSINDTVQECYPQLIEEWWGTRESLHVDCYGKLEQVDKYDISLSETPFTGQEKLYFANMGGYKSGQFKEQHHDLFLVATDNKTAKARALESIQEWDHPHKDCLLEVENLLCLSEIAREKGAYIHLTKSDQEKPFTFFSGYQSII